jgi:hypothetical protein
MTRISFSAGRRYSSLTVEQLEDRSVPAVIVPPGGQRFAVGTDDGGGGLVSVFAPNGTLLSTFAPFPGFGGALHVATGDVNRDGIEDTVVGAGLGPTGGHVKVFDGVTGNLIASFFSFAGFAGGVNVAVGDINNDGAGDIVVGTATASSHVKVFDFATGGLFASFLSFDGFAGGVSVATGNYDGIGGDDIVVGSASAFSHVKVFDINQNLLASFLAIPNFTGGVNVAAADLRNNDGLAELLVAPATGNGQVQTFLGGTSLLLSSFDPSFSGVNGLRIATGDANGDGFPDVLVGPGPGQVGVIKAFASFALQVNAVAAFSSFKGGVFVG